MLLLAVRLFVRVSIGRCNGYIRKTVRDAPSIYSLGIGLSPDVRLPLTDRKVSGGHCSRLCLGPIHVLHERLWSR